MSRDFAATKLLAEKVCDSAFQPYALVSPPRKTPSFWLPGNCLDLAAMLSRTWLQIPPLLFMFCHAYACSLLIQDSGPLHMQNWRAMARSGGTVTSALPPASEKFDLLRRRASSLKGGGDQRWCQDTLLKVMVQPVILYSPFC